MTESFAAESIASIYQLNTKIDDSTAIRYSVHLDVNSITWKVFAHESNSKSDNNDNNNNDKSNSNNIIQLYTLLSDIKLCYVNFEASNLIIWLLTKYPTRVDNANETPQLVVDQQTTSAVSGTIAIVCQCVCEQDVIRLREAYKKLRSIKKYTSDVNYEKTINKKVHLTTTSSSMANWSRNETGDSSGKSRKQITTNQTIPKGQTVPTFTKQIQNNILNRQRQPAKVIYEHCALTSHETVGHYNNHGFVYATRAKKYSESEFDPSQFENYLSPVEHRFASLKTRSRFRSRSMEPQARRSRGPIHIRLGGDGRLAIEKENMVVGVDKINHSDIMHLSQPAGKLIRNDNFNSEGSSLSDDSSTGGDKFENSSNSKMPSPIVKSALKKSKSHRDGDNITKPSSFSSNIYAAAIFLNNSLFHLDRSKSTAGGNLKNKKPVGSNYLTLKKNVTFSSYATIQVVDN